MPPGTCRDEFHSRETDREKQDRQHDQQRDLAGTRGCQLRTRRDIRLRDRLNHERLRGLGRHDQNLLDRRVSRVCRLVHDHDGRGPVVRRRRSWLRMMRRLRRARLLTAVHEPAR